MANVHVVDDDASFRTAMGRLLSSAGYAVALYESADQLLERLPQEDGPSCILLDVRIPGLSGPDLQDRLSERRSTSSIVFLTGYADVSTSVRAMKGGAEDFLTKPVAWDELRGAVERAIARSNAACDRRNRLAALSGLVARLTPRENEVFELVVRGHMNKQIAHELGTTERTVKAHRRQVMEKMSVQSLAELVSIAERLGLLAVFRESSGAGPAQPQASQHAAAKRSA